MAIRCSKSFIYIHKALQFRTSPTQTTGKATSKLKSFVFQSTYSTVNISNLYMTLQKYLKSWQKTLFKPCKNLWKTSKRPSKHLKTPKPHQKPLKDHQNLFKKKKKRQKPLQRTYNSTPLFKAPPKHPSHLLALGLSSRGGPERKAPGRGMAAWRPAWEPERPWKIWDFCWWVCLFLWSLCCQCDLKFFNDFLGIQTVFGRGFVGLFVFISIFWGFTTGRIAGFHWEALNKHFRGF